MSSKTSDELMCQHQLELERQCQALEDKVTQLEREKLNA